MSFQVEGGKGQLGTRRPLPTKIWTTTTISQCKFIIFVIKRLESGIAPDNADVADDQDDGEEEEDEEEDNQHIISLHKNGKGGKTVIKKEEDEEVYLESEDEDDDEEEDIVHGKGKGV